MCSARALRFLLLSAACFVTPAVGHSQEATTSDVFLLDEILVSGGLTGIAKDNFTRAYSKVTREEIARRGLKTVESALRALPGLSVVSTGDSMTSVFIRGGESNHTLVLIDGVEVNTTTNGSYSFSGLSAADIDSIEVLRGPQATLYGTSAMAGVIAITTQKADKPGLSYGGGVELGGLDSHMLNASLRQGLARGQLSFAAESRRSDGEDGSRTDGDTEFNNMDTVSLNGDHAVTDSVTIGFSLRHFTQSYGYDGTDSAATRPEDYIVDSGDTADRDESYGALWAEAEALDGRLLNRLELSAMDQDTSYDSPSWGVSNYGSTRQALKYTGSFALDGTEARGAAQKLNLLLEAERETFDVATAWSTGKESRNSRSVALEYQGRFDNGIDLQAGVRHDVIDVFEDPTSWNLSAAWRQPGSALRLRGSIGRATVYPTMYEQFGYTPGLFTGNPDLKPEHSLSYELGADLDLPEGRGTLGVTLFQSDIEDMIASTGTSATNLAGTSTRKGVELSATWQANDWLHLAGSYTYTHGRSPGGERLVRRPAHEFGLQASADILDGRANVSADLRHVAGSYDQEWFGAGSGTISKLPQFTTVDLAARYDLTANVALTGRIVNLFDADYSEAWGYYGQSRTAYLELSAKW